MSFGGWSLTVWAGTVQIKPSFLIGIRCLSLPALILPDNGLFKTWTWNCFRREEKWYYENTLELVLLQFKCAYESSRGLVNMQRFWFTGYGRLQIQSQFSISPCVYMLCNVTLQPLLAMDRLYFPPTWIWIGLWLVFADRMWEKLYYASSTPRPFPFLDPPPWNKAKLASRRIRDHMEENPGTPDESQPASSSRDAGSPVAYWSRCTREPAKTRTTSQPTSILMSNYRWLLFEGTVSCGSLLHSGSKLIEQVHDGAW